jgi:hypothetical protein
MVSRMIEAYRSATPSPATATVTISAAKRNVSEIRKVEAQRRTESSLLETFGRMETLDVWEAKSYADVLLH